MVAISSLAFVCLLDAGLTPTLKNKMSAAAAANDTLVFQATVNAALTLSTLTVIAGLLLLPILSIPNWLTLFHVSAAIGAGEVLRVVQVVYLGSLLNLSTAFVEAIYAARLRLSTVLTFHTIGAVVGFGAVLLSVSLRLGLPFLAFLSVAPTLAVRAVLFVVLSRETGLLHLHVTGLPRYLREFCPSSVSFIGIQIANIVLNALPNVLVARLIDLDTVALLSVTQRVTSVPLILVAAITPVMWPAFTIAWVRRDTRWIRERLGWSAACTAAALALYTIVLAWGGQPLLALWLRGTVEIPSSLIVVLGAWTVLQSLQYWLSTFLHSISDLTIQLACYFAQAVALSLLALPLARRAGLVGVGASMAFSLAVATIVPLGARSASRLRSHDRLQTETNGQVR